MEHINYVLKVEKEFKIKSCLAQKSLLDCERLYPVAPIPMFGFSKYDFRNDVIYMMQNSLAIAANNADIVKS